MKNKFTICILVISIIFLSALIIYTNIKQNTSYLKTITILGNEIEIEPNIYVYKVHQKSGELKAVPLTWPRSNSVVALAFSWCSTLFLSFIMDIQKENESLHVYKPFKQIRRNWLKNLLDWRGGQSHFLSFSRKKESRTSLDTTGLVRLSSIFWHITSGWIQKHFAPKGYTITFFIFQISIKWKQAMRNEST